MNVVGVDLGGTNMHIGVVDQRNRIIGRKGKKTRVEEGSRAVIDRLCLGINQACEDAGCRLSDITAVGVAAPGAMDIPRGIVLDAPNMAWRNFPLRDILRRRLRKPIVLDNDVNGAVWGEFCLGLKAAGARKTSAASKARPEDLLGVWVGTGVGGGLVIGGRLFHGQFFTAGEIGLTVLFPDGRKGRRTVEDWCSRTGMSRTIALRLKDHPKSMLRDLTNGTGKVTGSKQLAKAYAENDALAREVVHEAADLLGTAVANVVTLLSVGTVILGGGVTEALGSQFVDRVRTAFQRSVFPKRCAEARILMTRLKSDAGVLGAALLARRGDDRVA
jgi:glucokinase